MKDHPDNVQSTFLTHNTPPPILVENGSFILEKKEVFATNDTDPVTGRKRYRIQPDTGTTIVPAHIKILDGSGEMLYRNDAAADCVVTTMLRLASGGQSTVNLMAASDHTSFIVEVDGSKSLDVGVGADKPTSTKRNKRYRHSGGVQEISQVTVKEAGAILYNVLTENLPDAGGDLRIMIWLEPADH